MYSPSLKLHYGEDYPLNIVRGEGVYFYDEHGQRYLDTINNVAHGMCDRELQVIPFRDITSLCASFFNDVMLQLVTVTPGLLRHAHNKWLCCVPTLAFLTRGYVPIRESFAPHSQRSFLTVSSPILGERGLF